MGYHVLTLFHSDDNVDVVVNRGWVPYGAAKTKEWERPSGHMEVVGILSKGEEVINMETELIECAIIVVLIPFYHQLTNPFYYSFFTTF